jgi:lipoprotein signal peptidase
MMVEVIHWLSTICDEILTWMIEIWMEKQLVSDTNCNNIIPQFFLQEMTNNVGLTFSVGDTQPSFTNSSEQDN